MAQGNAFGSVSIGDKLRASKGIGKGFDMLRLLLAVAVVAWHSNALLGNANEDLEPVWWFPGYAILSLFFALSGFLIAGSAARLRLRDFLVNRGMRIFPALAVEIVLSALILGPLFTNLSISSYFSDHQTWRYFTNIVAIINFKLPGVFFQNDSHIVNVSLWTVPYEFICYALMSGIILFSLLNRPALILTLALVIVVAGMLGAYGLHMTPGQHYASYLVTGYSNVFVDQQSRLIVSFLLGIVIFLLRDRIPYSHRLALVAGAICVGVAVLSPAMKIGYPLVNLLAGPPLAYLMAYFGVSNVPTPAVFKKGDYSYGIYLYGWPMQQVLIALFPTVHSSVLQFFMAMVLIVAFAVFSWHVIEKPILKLRKKFSFVARERIPDEQVPAPLERASAALQPPWKAEGSSPGSSV